MVLGFAIEHLPGVPCRVETSEVIMEEALSKKLSVAGTAVAASSSLSLCLGLAALYLLITALRRRTGRPRSTLPPGPRPWPFIGNLHLLGALPHQSLAILARTHGPLMSLRLGSLLTVVASSPDMAKAVLQTFDHALASRPRTAATLHTLFDSSDIAFAPYGPYWKLMRRICISDLLHVKHLDSFKPIRTEEMDALVRRVLDESQTGKPTLILRKLQEAASNMISRMALGKTFKELNISTGNNGSADSIVALVKEITYLLGSFNVGDYIPYLAWMDLQGLERRMKDAKRRVKAALGKYIEDRRAAGIGSDAAAATPGRDLLDVLLSLQASGQQQQLDAPITDDNITAVILDMYLGGTETVASTLEWAIAELMSSPSSMEKVMEELDRVVGRERLVQETDIEDLLYLHAVVRETMRLHPAAPLLLPRLAMQPCSDVGGYCIPAETTVYVNVWAIGRDPEMWEEPLAFRPERVLGSEVEYEKGHHFELLPFGSGRRKCPGWELGLLNMHLMAARLLQSFDWRLPGGTRLDLSEGFDGINVLMANKLTLHASPRLPIRLYPQQHRE